MKLSIVIVGIDGWEDFTLPAILSIEKHSPSANLIVVDAASKVPYPTDNLPCTVLRLDESSSYSYAINKGIEEAGDSDWYLVLNNDILVYGEIIVDELSEDVIYGKQILEEKGHRWLGLWIAMLSKKTIDLVGKFDEKFLLCGFEDADYCIRAFSKGIKTEFFQFPVKHFWGKTRWGLPNYKGVRIDNINYLEEKQGVRLGDNIEVVHD